MANNYFSFVIARQIELQNRKIHRRLIRDATNPFEYPDNEFQRLYRLSKDMLFYLCNELSGELVPINSRDGLPVHIKVLTCVRLLADGSYQRGTGQDHGVCIAQTTVSKYLSQFLEAVIKILLPKWIYFPSTEEGRRKVSDGFILKFNLPHILGAIDCTHVSIFPPPQPHGIQYKNRKGYHSINTQLVVDVNCRILSINARYPGRVHDQFIFNNSLLKAELQRLYENQIGDYYLLCDSGYALEPWLMTPVLNAELNSPADKYTKWHCQVRNCVERANGYLKGSFRILGIDRNLHYKPEKSSKIIYTCATLYNIMLHYRVPVDQTSELQQTHDEVVFNSDTLLPSYGTEALRVAEAKRSLIIETYF